MAKVILRKIRKEDAKRMYELFASDKLLKAIGIPKRSKGIKMKDEVDYVKKAIQNYGKKKPESFKLAITIDGVFIGVIGTSKIDYVNENAEIGCWIGEEYWGKGYASDATREFVKVLFKKFKFKRIYAYTLTFNVASQRVLEKAGFKLEGELKKSSKIGKKFFDDKLYAIVR